MDVRGAGLLLTGLIAASGLVYLWAATKGVRAVTYALKPGTMALIIGLAVLGLRGGGMPPLYGWAVLAGLLFSVAGDVFLMLPRERFLAGLAAFFLAHLCYIGAMVGGLPLRFGWWDGLSLVALGLVAVPVYRRLAAGVREQGKPALLGSVAAYITVITLMVWRGLDSGPMVAGGALLFYLSDFFLAWDKFVRPLPWRHVLVMATYFGAQYCFALSVSGA